MPLFKSSKEKRFWVWSFATVAAIFATLFVGQPLAELFGNQDIQAVIFSAVMLLIGATIVLHALKKRPGNIELTIWLGVAAVYIMLFLRLGLPERTHLMEYSVLAIFIHKALTERFEKEDRILKPALYAFLMAVSIGIIDELIQKLLPNRVFDPEDILFNTIAVGMAIGASLIISWIRGKKGDED